MKSVKVFIPKHSSALHFPPPPINANQGLVVGAESPPSGSTCNPTAACTRTNNYNCTILQIHVHRERAMWNIFQPLFAGTTTSQNDNTDNTCRTRTSGSSDDNLGTEIRELESENNDSIVAARLLLKIVINQMKPSFLGDDAELSMATNNHDHNHDQISDDSGTSSTTSKFKTDLESTNNDTNKVGSIENKNDAMMCSNEWNESTFYIQKKMRSMKKKPNHSSSSSSRSIKRKRKTKNIYNKPSSLIILYILPPSAFTFTLKSYKPNMEPERIFTSSLVQLENLQIRLQSLNAYIATLGGGYFLCHYLHSAVSLARYQRQIAYQLNDTILVMKCTINEAYNYIHAGLIDNALLLIRKTEDMAIVKKRNRCGSNIGDEEGDEDLIISMCHAARWFAGRVRDGMESTNQEEEKHNNRDGNNDSNNDGNKNNNNNNLVQLGDATNKIMYKETPVVKNSMQKIGSCNPSSTISSTHDDFQRIRVVRVRTVSKNIKII